MIASSAHGRTCGRSAGVLLNLGGYGCCGLHIDCFYYEQPVGSLPSPGGEFEKRIYMYIYASDCYIQIGYALITETDPDCYLWLLIPSHKNGPKKKNPAVMKQMDRTVKVFISYIAMK